MRSKNRRKGSRRRRTARAGLSEYYKTSAPTRGTYGKKQTYHSIVVYSAACKADKEPILSAFTTFRPSKTRFQPSGFLDECHG